MSRKPIGNLNADRQRGQEPIRRIYLPAPLPQRPLSGHKGLFGRVLVVGGAHHMFGAAVLAGLAALRCGSGLVQIAVPEAVLSTAISAVPELVGLPLTNAFTAGSRKELAAALERADVVVVGPGMGVSATAVQRLRFIAESGRPCVIDADALNALAAQGLTLLEPLRCPAVFTPHPGEMLRLGQRLGLEPAVVPEDETSRIHHAVIAARKLKHTVLLKGHRTVVSDGQRLYVNRTGDSSLSKAGAGDVLAGVIGSLMGQGMSAFDGACAAAWIHGRAGELAGAELGRRSALARDVIAQLGRAIAEYERRHA